MFSSGFPDFTLATVGQGHLHPGPTLLWPSPSLDVDWIGDQPANQCIGYILPTIICCICVLVYSYNRICDFRVPIFQGPYLPHQHFPGAQFAGARFAGARFAAKGPNLPGPNLPGPDLPPTKFLGPNLPHPKFSGAQSAGGPICRGPICRGPICRGPICRGPICHKNRSGPNLPGAQFAWNPSCLEHEF